MNNSFLIGILSQPRGVEAPTPINEGPEALSITVNESGGIYTGSATYFDFEDDLEDAPLPIAFGVSIQGILAVDQELTLSYGYRQINNASEGDTLIKLYQADDDLGTNQTVLYSQVYSASHTFNYTLLAGSEGKKLALGITPVTTSGTIGTEVKTPWSATVQPALTERKLRIAFGGTGLTDPSSAGDKYNLARTSSPNSSFSLTNMVDVDNVPAGINLVVVSAFSPQNFGAVSDDGGGFFFPALAIRGYWYVGSSGATRSFKFAGLTLGRTYKLSMINSASSPVSGVNTASVAFGGISKSNPDCLNNTSEALVWDYSEGIQPNGLGEVVVAATDGVGVCPINCIELSWYE